VSHNRPAGLERDQIISINLRDVRIINLLIGESMSTAPKSEVLTFAEMVNYQDAAVVSRQITKEEAGNVTLFAFDKGQGLSEHTAPFDALAHILEGEAQVIISGKPFDLQAGNAIIMPANEPHALKATQRFKMLLTMIRP
jgi:quercetin dioxygenase-like cupin family protein